ncbi:hypothetical protein [Cellulomonas endometrii]|uniref:hypothetical protein n=1 Tax=Cellulomonas endometrii TaxID=3036301 RepID=UPI0024AD840A|nr:hypothetical protein [Cellulomonas endometrii]
MRSWLGRRLREQVTRAPAEQSLDRGVALFQLAADRTWRHRRIDSIRLEDGDQGRWSTTLDCTVPDDPRLRWQDSPLVAVPMALLAKGAMRGFDIRDASGQPLSVLRLDEGVDLSLDLLRFLIVQLDQIPFTPELEVALREILGPNHPDSEELLTFLDEGTLDGVQAIAPEHVNRLSGVTQRFLLDLNLNFYLYVLVDQETCGQRQIVKFSRSWIQRGMATGRRHLFQAGFGTKAAVVKFKTTPRDAESYHLQVHMPPGLRAESLTLLLPQDSMTEDFGGGSVAHVRCSTPASLYAGTPFGAELVVSMNDRGLARQASVLSVAAFLFFLASFVFPGAMQTMRESKDSAALLLAIPAALAVFTLGAREHPLKTQMLVAPRAAIALSAGALVLAATSLTWELRDLWFPIYWTLSLAATGACAWLTLQGERSRRRRWRQTTTVSFQQPQGGPDE